jgi:hypothetical protein
MSTGHQPHGHSHHQHHSHNHTFAPSGPASVVLDLGGDTGALVILTGPERCGQEIEVSRTDGLDLYRTHAAVRARNVRPRTVYGVVIAGLAAGRYTIWQDRDTPLTTVTVVSGVVTEYEWVEHRPESGAIGA